MDDLSVLDGEGPLARSELVQRQVHGLKVPEATVQATVDGLRSSGLVAPANEAHGARGHSGERDDLLLALTAAGEAAHRPVRRGVSRITEEIYGDLPPADLEATHRTLVEVTRRANARLAATGG